LDKRLSLTTSIQIDFLPVVTGFVEKANLAFGLGKSETLKLTLAAEEIFAYLCRMTKAGEMIEVSCSGGIYYGAVEFLFSRRDFNMKGFNITAKISPESEEGLEEMGLLIAARSVDHLQMIERDSERLSLSLVKEKEYPPDPDVQIPEIPYMDLFSIKTPSPEEIKAFVALLNFHYEKYLTPPSFKIPGKVADMVFSGEYGAAVAVNHKGLTGGGILWRRLGEKTIECFGPYLFQQKSNVRLAESLLNSFLGRIAKTEILGIFSKYPTSHLPKGYFESLGTITYFREDKTLTALTAFFRQLIEDTGAYVWASQELKPFLEEEYKRLVLPREIHLAKYQGEHKDLHSVFTSEFDKELNGVTLRAIWPGKDTLENLQRHIQVFKEEKLLNILFEMDLGISWQADLADPLLTLGFKPRFIIPYGGHSDLVVFQLPI
jgi:hypothetical protein